MLGLNFGNSLPNRTKSGRFLAWEASESDAQNVEQTDTGSSLMGDINAKNVNESSPSEQHGICPD